MGLIEDPNYQANWQQDSAVRTFDVLQLKGALHYYIEYWPLARLLGLASGTFLKQNNSPEWLLSVNDDLVHFNV